MNIALELRSAKLANLLTTTEMRGSGKKARTVLALELKLEFEDVPADEVVMLLGNPKASEFRNAFWGDDGNPRFVSLGEQHIDLLPIKNGYHVEVSGMREDASMVKEWAFVPVGGHRCRLSCKVRILNYGKNFLWFCAQHQQQLIAEISLIPTQEELPV